ncbi:MAG: hypothetical protein FWB91_01510 [Defluviitaleaceae bacterium]|nr:hypothetical protein [Defluviitaleaceae bacterium]
MISKIFIGMILVFINFNLDIGYMRIGIIPSFLGYYFMLKGLAEIMELSSRFSKVIPYVKGMIVYSVIIYVMDLLGGATAIDLLYIYTPTGLLMLAIGIITIVLSLFISYNIIMGVKDIEITQEQDLNSDRLYLAWKLLVVFSVLTHIVILLYITAFAVVGILVSFLIQIYYLFAFYRTKTLYYEKM